jgi:glycosyltransferase involved in cell wall biosynthesis
VRICALVAAFNEEETIAAVIAGVHRYVPDVLVVDDGSTDRTAERALEAGARVVSHGTNQPPLEPGPLSDLRVVRDVVADALLALPAGDQAQHLIARQYVRARVRAAGHGHQPFSTGTLTHPGRLRAPGVARPACIMPPACSQVTRNQRIS